MFNTYNPLQTLGIQNFEATERRSAGTFVTLCVEFDARTSQVSRAKLLVMRHGDPPWPTYVGRFALL